MKRNEMPVIMKIGLKKRNNGTWNADYVYHETFKKD